MFFRSGGVSKLLGGFRLNAITQYQGGFPLNITTQGAAGQAGLSFVSGALRPNLTGDPSFDNNRTRDEQINQYFNTLVFTTPAPYTFGNTPRTLSNLRGPSSFSTNMSLQRNLKFSETTRLQLTAEAFNVFNQVNLRDPGTNAAGAVFGIISGAEPPRRIQLAVKLFF